MTMLRWGLPLAVLVILLLVWQLRGPEERHRAPAGDVSSWGEKEAGTPDRPACVPVSEYSSGTRAVLLKDLVDLSGVSGLRVVAEGPGTEQVALLTTDTEGRVAMPRGMTRVRPESDKWRIIDSDVPGAEGPVLLYGFKLVDLTGIVKDERGPVSGARVLFEILGNEPPLEGRSPRIFWLKERHVEVAGTAETAEDGTFSILVPRINALTVSAFTTGHHSDAVSVELTRASDRQHVTLELKPGTRVDGVLMDEDGNPIKDIAIMAYITTSGRASVLTEKEALTMASGTGLAYRADERQDKAEATFVYFAPTDKFGRYSFAFNHTGETIVRANVPGHRTISEDLGCVYDSRSLDLIARPAQGPRVIQVLVQGVPAGGAMIDITEVTQGQPQMTCSLKADEMGRIPDWWLEMGRYYVISAGGLQREFVEWRGQASVDITPMDKKNYQLLPKGWWPDR